MKLHRLVGEGHGRYHSLHEPICHYKHTCICKNALTSVSVADRKIVVILDEKVTKSTNHSTGLHFVLCVIDGRIASICFDEKLDSRNPFEEMADV